MNWAWYAGGWSIALADGRRPASEKRKIIYTRENGSPNFQPHHQPFNYHARFAPGTADRAGHLTLDRWGAPDVIVHNGRYIGPGHMDRFLDTPIELLEKQIWGNVLAPLTLNRLPPPLPGLDQHFVPAPAQRASQGDRRKRVPRVAERPHEEASPGQCNRRCAAARSPLHGPPRPLFVP